MVHEQPDGPEHHHEPPRRQASGRSVRRCGGSAGGLHMSSPEVSRAWYGQRGHVPVITAARRGAHLRPAHRQGLGPAGAELASGAPGAPFAGNVTVPDGARQVHQPRRPGQWTRPPPWAEAWDEDRSGPARASRTWHGRSAPPSGSGGGGIRPFPSAVGEQPPAGTRLPTGTVACGPGRQFASPLGVSRREVARYPTKQTMAIVQARVTGPSPSPSPPRVCPSAIQSAREAPRGRVMT
jgi:hypothetical protein